MSNKENENFYELSSTEQGGAEVRADPLADPTQLISHEIPAGVDRRGFLIRSAVVGAAALMTGRLVSAQERTEKAVATMPPPQIKGVPPPPLLSKDLDVVKQQKGPVLTTVDEFYKVGP